MNRVVTRAVLWIAPVAILVGALAMRMRGKAEQPRNDMLTAFDSNSSQQRGNADRSNLRAGDQVVVVFIGATFCHGADAPEFAKSVEKMKQLVRQQADSAGEASTVIGVALDWQPDDGIKWLRRFGSFDEVAAGGNWLNAGAIKYIFRDLPGEPGIPQVAIIRRHVEVGTRQIAISPEHLVSRKIGADEIMKWVDDGARIPAPN